MVKSSIKKIVLLLSLSFFCCLVFFATSFINPSSADDCKLSNEEYANEIAKIKALPPEEGKAAYDKLNRVCKILVFSQDDTGKTIDVAGRHYNKDFANVNTWLDEDGNEYKGSQKAIFEYYGVDADCIQEEGVGDNTCRSKHSFWNPGTLKMAGNLVVEGMGLAFNYFDGAGVHWIMTGTYEPLFNVLGFNTVDKSLSFKGNIFIEKNLKMSNGSNSVFLKSNNSSERIAQSNNNTSVSSGAGNDLSIFELEQSEANVYSLPENKKHHTFEYRVRSSGGLEIQDFLKTEEIIFKEGLLHYCNPLLDPLRNLTQRCELEVDSLRMHTENFIYKIVE